MLFDTEVAPFSKVLDLWNAVGWNDGRKHMDNTYKALVGADFARFAYEDGVLVGCIAALTDGWNVWVSYLCVHPDWQRQGVGTKLLELLYAEYKGLRIYVQSEHSGEYYLSKGFHIFGTSLEKL